MSITKEDLLRKKALFPISSILYSINNQLLRICFKPEISEDTIRELADRYNISVIKGEKMKGIPLAFLRKKIKDGELIAEIKGVQIDAAEKAQIIIFDQGMVRCEDIKIAA